MLFRRAVLLIACVVSFLLPTSVHASRHTDFWLYGSALHKFYDDGTRDVTRVDIDGTSSFSIADENGTPMFFGSGKTVFKYKEDGNHQLLTNDLDANDSQPQAAAFIPDNNTSNIVHLVYISSGGLKYSTLDYSKDEVEDIWVERDVPIAGTHQSRAIALTNHVNKKYVWIISHLKERTANKSMFENVLFDGTTFTKKESNPSLSERWDTIDFFKISPNGKRLVYSRNDKISGSAYDRIKFGVCIFDNGDGDIGCNSLTSLPTGIEELNTGGVSFSANGRYLYLSTGAAGEIPQFYQIDLENPGLDADVLMDVTLPEGESGGAIGGGQLAPDENIYYSSGISGYELVIKNPDKACVNGSESGAHIVFQYNPKLGKPRLGAPLFNQSYLFKEPLMIKRDNANLQLDIDSTRLPAGTLQSYGICWSDSGTPTIADSKLSATSPSAPPVWDMSAHLVKGTRYTIRSFATIDGTTYYYDMRKVTLSPPPPVEIYNTAPVAVTGELVTLNVVPVAGCRYKWELESGSDVTILNATSANASFIMPASDVVMKISITTADGAYASKNFVIKNGPCAAIETPFDVSNGGTVSLIGQHIEDVTYLWEQTGGPSVTITNPNAREAQFDATSIADGTSLTFRLTVTYEIGVRSVATKTITVRTPPAITFMDIVSKARADVRVDLKVQPVAGATYAWTQTAGVPVTVDDANTANAAFIMPASAGVMTFELVVTDSYYLTSTKSVTIKRDAPPVAQAGPDQNVTEGNTVTLSADGSSDPMGEELSFTWTQTSGTAVPLTTVDDSNRTFVAPVVPAAGESLVFKLEATDPDGQRDTDTVTVNVTYLNDPPVANAGPDLKAETGKGVTLSGVNSYDPDEQSLSYKWVQIGGKAVTFDDDTKVWPRFTAPNVSGALRFRLTVKDDQGLTATDDVVCNIVTFGSEKTAPIANAGPDYTVEYGAPVTLNGFNSHARGNDNYLKLYSWELISDDGTPVALDTPTAARASFTAPDSATRLVFMLTVTDNNDLEGTDIVVINVTDSGTPPVADAGSDQLVSNGAMVTLDASGSSATGSSIVSYRWDQVSGIPVELSDSTVPAPTFDAPMLASGGEALEFRLAVTNAEGMSDCDTVIVNIDGGGIHMPTAVADNDVDDSGKSVEGATVTLDASGSYANGEATLMSCSWKQVAGPMAPLSDPSAINPTFVCPATDVETSLVFELTVTDNNNMESVGRTTVVYLPNAFSDIDDDQIVFTAFDGVQYIGITPKEPEAGSDNARGAIVALKPVNPSGVTGTGTAPTSMPYGLIDFKIRVEKPGDSTEVMVEFPEAAPAGWVKLNGSGAWVDYTEHVTFNDDRTVATIRLVDGGIGDDDGIANGIIVDPSGPGTYTSSSSDSSSGGGGGGGCTMTPSSPFTIDLLLLLGGCVGLILYRRKQRKTVQ